MRPLDPSERDVLQLDQRARDPTVSRRCTIGAVDTGQRRLETSIAARVLATMQHQRSEVGRAADGDALPESIGEGVDLASRARCRYASSRDGSTRRCRPRSRAGATTLDGSHDGRELVVASTT